MWREIKEQGYPGTHRMITRYIARLRVSGVELPLRPGIKSGDGKTTVFKTPSTKRVAWWLLQSPEDLKPGQRAFLEQFINLCPEAEKMQEMGRQFRAMIREQLAPKFDEWMKKGQEIGIKELANFVKGIKQDQAAVKAALKFQWSQGQVEGQVNRLKMLKRQMYGRAKFDLLKARVLHRV
jgi:transposase